MQSIIEESDLFRCLVVNDADDSELAVKLWTKGHRPLCFKPYCLKYELEKVLGRFKEKKDKDLFQKQFREKRTPGEKLGKKKGDFLEDSMLPISSWEVGVNFCSTFKAFAFAYPVEQQLSSYSSVTTTILQSDDGKEKMYESTFTSAKSSSAIQHLSIL